MSKFSLVAVLDYDDDDEGGEDEYYDDNASSGKGNGFSLKKNNNFKDAKFAKDFQIN